MDDAQPQESVEDLESFRRALKHLGSKDEPPPGFFDRLRQEVRERYPESCSLTPAGLIVDEYFWSTLEKLFWRKALIQQHPQQQPHSITFDCLVDEALPAFLFFTETIPVNKRSSQRKWQLYREILRDRLQGDTGAEIAERLHCSLSTVYRAWSHTRLILRYFDVLILRLRERLDDNHLAGAVYNMSMRGYDRSEIMRILDLSPEMIDEAYARLGRTFITVVNEFIPNMKTVKQGLFLQDDEQKQQYGLIG
jgi:hypothetical protein